MINLLSRTINQAGGFLWVDLLEQEVQGQDGEAYELGRDLVQMILQAGRGQKQVFDYINFISQLDKLELSPESKPLDQFVRELDGHMKKLLADLAGKYHRRYYSMIDIEGLEGNVSADPGYMKRIAKELLINAVKYSPEGSRILLVFEPCRDVSGQHLDVSIRNVPRAAQARDQDGNPIIGIPYDYTELVFDLFYTIESFPVTLEEEEWSDGTGLYVVRKLLRRQGGWVKAANGVDYTGDAPEPFVKVTMTLPVKEAS
jgi:signal transduction histidine kinase